MACGVCSLEEGELLLHVVPLPEGEAVELLDGHLKESEELLRGQVPLEEGTERNRWEQV